MESEKKFHKILENTENIQINDIAILSYKATKEFLNKVINEQDGFLPVYTKYDKMLVNPSMTDFIQLEILNKRILYFFYNSDDYKKWSDDFRITGKRPEYDFSKCLDELINLEYEDSVIFKDLFFLRNHFIGKQGTFFWIRILYKSIMIFKQFLDNIQIYNFNIKDFANLKLD